MTLLAFITGIILGYITKHSIHVFKNKDNKSKKIKNEYLRRGIYNNSYTISRQGSKIGEVDVQFEIGEIERTSAKSKVRVITLKASSAEYNKGGDDYDKLKSMIDNSWLISQEIEWIETPIDKIRDEKIDQILNEK
jgi:hypothetical protein